MNKIVGLCASRYKVKKETIAGKEHWNIVSISLRNTFLWGKWELFEESFIDSGEAYKRVDKLNNVKDDYIN